MFVIKRLISDAPQVITTLLVFSLSSGILGGILFYIDSAGPYVLDEMTEEVPIHMRIHFTRLFYQESQITIANAIDNIASEVGVHAAEHLTVIDGNFEKVWYMENSQYRRYIYIGVSERFFDFFSNAIQLSNDSTTLTDDGCYLEKSIAQRNGIVVGDSYNISVVTGYGFGWITTISRRFKVLGTFEAKGLWGDYSFGDETRPRLKAIVKQESIEQEFDFLGHTQQNALHDRIWVRLDYNMFHQDDPQEAEKSMQNLRKRIEQKIAPDAIVIEYEAIGIVRGYASWYSSMIAIAIAFSIPTIIMGIILVHYTSELQSDRRRRDIGMLRVRGATNWQALEWVFSIAIINGVVGGVGAIITGILAAILSGNTKRLLTFDFTQHSGFSILLEPSAVAVIFIFSLCLGLVVSIPSTIKVLLLSPTEAHHKVERETQVGAEHMSNPIVDVLLIVFSGFVSIQLIFVMGGGLAVSRGWLMTGLSILLFGAFIVFLTRLLARSSGRIKCWIMDKIRNPSHVVGTRVIGRTAALKVKSEALGIMFIALVFTAGVFSATSSHTGTTQIENLIKFEIGADMVVEVSPSLGNISLQFVDEIRNIDGVLDASAMLSFYAVVHYRTIGPYSTITHYRTINVYGIEPSKWAKTAFLLPFFTKYNLPEEDLQHLEDNKTDVISSFRPVEGYDVASDQSYSPIYGEDIDLIIGNILFNVTIIDIMSEDESTDSKTYLPGESDVTDFLVTNLALIHEEFNTSIVNKFYIKLHENANHTKITEEIMSLAPHSFSSIDSARDKIDEILGSRNAQSIYGVYTLSVLFSMTFLTIGVCIVSLQKNRAFRRQFSVIRAMGSRSKSLQSAMLIDACLSIAIASIIGIFVGIFLSNLVIGTPLTYLGISESRTWDRLPIQIAIPYELLGIILLTSYVIPLIGTYIITRHNLRLGLAEELQVGE